MNTFSILINDSLTALTKTFGYDIHVARHNGLADYACEIAAGLFGFRSISVTPTDYEYTYLGYQAIVSRIR